MGDIASAIRASNDRKERLATALGHGMADGEPVRGDPEVTGGNKPLPETPKAVGVHYYTPGYKTGHKLTTELIHMEEVLKGSGLSVADLLRTVAKHFHGVSLPVYSPDAED